MTLLRVLRQLKKDYPRLRLDVADIKKPDHLWIMEFIVEEDFRGQGIGTRVIQELQKTGRTISLTPRAYPGREEDLERFYLRLGFQWEGEKKQMSWRVNNGQETTQSGG